MLINIKGIDVLVDDDDVERVLAHGWCPHRSAQSGVYFCASITAISNKPVSLHRFIMKLSPKDNKVVDHINGDTLDNRKENLRICTTKGNNRNSSTPRNNTSGYKGVTKRGKLYMAYIKVNYKQIRLNSWSTIEDAARMYDIAALYYFGEFAKTNFPKDEYTGMDIRKEMQTRIRRLPTKNTSGTVGVYFRKDTRKWAAQIAFTDHVQTLGSFSSKKEAISARREAERLYSRVNLHERDIIKSEYEEN